MEKDILFAVCEEHASPTSRTTLLIYLIQLTISWISKVVLQVTITTVQIRWHTSLFSSTDLKIRPWILLPAEKRTFDFKHFFHY